MKIGVKISLVLVLFILPVLLTAYISYSQLQKISQPLFIEFPKTLTELSDTAYLDQLANFIKYYDEVLTQAVRNYAFTEDKKWETIYRSTEPELDKVIVETQTKGTENEQNFFTLVDSANKALVVMEYQAIDYVNQGQTEEAIKILESDEYWRQKAIYKNGLVAYLEARNLAYDTAVQRSEKSLNTIIADSQKTIRSGQFNLLVIITITIGLVLLVALLFSLLITKPIRLLKKAVENFDQGHMDYRIKIKSRDEIGQLSRSFNQLAESLKQEQIKLQEYSQGLEAKVTEKTKDLNKKVEDLSQTREAILNVTEDIEAEKAKTELLARDLEKFKLAVDNASDHIVITDPEGIVLYGNKAIEKITGYKVEDALGKKAAALWKAPMPHEYYVKMWDTIKNKKQTFIGELQNRRKNGEIYDTKVSISPVLDNQGEIVFFVGLERDITHEKQIDRAKTEFVSLASHQLRTPLTAINWFTEMLLNEDAGKLNDEQKNYLQEVYKGNKRMVDLVNALLNVSRIDLGTFAIEPALTNIIELANDVIKEMQSQVVAKKLLISTSFAELPQISVDPKLMRIIFQNLISNAVKYTPEQGKIIVTVQKSNKAPSKKQPGTSLYISVADTGMGIPAAQKDKIFTKLFRADNVRAKETEGTGLGLYIIKSIVEQSFGTIWFDSEENKGTTFHILLPFTGMSKKTGTKGLN